MKGRFEFGMSAKALARWLYPGGCALCKSPLYLTEDHICRSCFVKLTPLRLPVCRGCGIEMPPHAEKSSRCSRCRSASLLFDEIISVYRYEDPFKNLLHQIKYERKYWLSEIFARKIKREFRDRLHERPSCIVPVPLDPRRARERTFNQSLLIARIISKILDVPVRKRVLLRKECRIPQSWLPRKERLANLKGLFNVNRPREIENQWVLLVDDVVTTGATAHECSKMMKEAGARKVSVFALARTPSLS